MKRIIEGKRYDTEKAIEIGSASNSHPGDFNWWEATLYKTPRSGVFFLAGEGGPMSRYAMTIGQNEWAGGERIDPMTKDEALKWAEKYLDDDTIEEHFGDSIEDA
ncbi:MAG: hypothetical protein RBS34_11640 [Desulfofustis sp.]|jgi:hypothetical protein|nr:hypothetical protein [Desulfofustis sp.]